MNQKKHIPPKGAKDGSPDRLVIEPLWEGKYKIIVPSKRVLEGLVAFPSPHFGGDKFFLPYPERLDDEPIWATIFSPLRG